MDPKVLREEMDRKVSLKRESMDEKVKRERQYMDRTLKVRRAKMDKMIQEERETLDQMLKQQRKSMDRILRQERETLDRMLKQQRKTVDMMLKEERQEMDRVIGVQRINMDAEIMQARMDMERKLHQEREQLDLKVLLEQKPTTKQLQKEIIPPPQAHEECIITSDRHIVMEFRIHVLGLEYYYNPKELYRNERIRYMRFLEPAKVEWDPMVETLKCYGHMWDSDVFYLDPMSEAPDGLVLMKGPEQVDELLHAHLGRKICDLYLVNTDSWSDSDDDEQEEEIEEALSGESLKEFMARMDRISSDENNFKRDRDSCGCSETDMDCNEAGCSQPKKQHAVRDK